MKDVEKVWNSKEVTQQYTRWAKVARFPIRHSNVCWILDFFLFFGGGWLLLLLLPWHSSSCLLPPTSLTHTWQCQPANVLFWSSDAEKIDVLPSLHIKQCEGMKKTHQHKSNTCTSEFMHLGSKWRVDGCIWGSSEHEGRPKKREIHQVSPASRLELPHCWQYTLLHVQTHSITSGLTTSPPAHHLHLDQWALALQIPHHPFHRLSAANPIPYQCSAPSGTK